MNRRLSVRLPEGLAWGIETEALRSGRTKSEIVRHALGAAGVAVPSSPECQREVLRHAAEARAQQREAIDAAALIREVRDEMEGRDGLESQDLQELDRCTGRRPGRSRATGRFQEGS
jgi:hypothetical protein